MPITYVPGNLLSTSAQTLVIPVNCLGVAGCGLALQYKRINPTWFSMYAQCCHQGDLKIGSPRLHWGMEPWVISFPTKDDYRNPSRMEDIEAGLVALVPLCERTGVTSIAFPKLGCGAGQLSWQSVRPLMENYLKQLSCPVFIYI